MNERLLHYIWQNSYYNQGSLATVDGEPVQVIFPGIYNTNQGPDFLQAKIRLGNAVFAGSVELHINSTDWHRHGHSTDKNYNNVILHVVYQHDADIGLPELELQGRIPGQLTDRYNSMMQGQTVIPCASSMNSIREITWHAWKERLIVERLEKRSARIRKMLEENKQHWNETLWWLLAKNFGGNINGETFEEIARSLPVIILSKHKEQNLQIEALLFGQAGLLNERTGDKYYLLLQREFQFLQKKYSLKPVNSTVHFLRMRPGNFPTVRLAQLAMLIKNSSHLFSRILTEEKCSAIVSMLQVTANDYWHYHYRFEEEGKFLPKKVGTDTIHSIMINTVVPLLFAYGSYRDEEQHVIKALRWLEQLPAEKNSITREYESLGVVNTSSFDSQALIELKKNYCNEKRCLQCAVGNAVLKADVV